MMTSVTPIRPLQLVDGGPVSASSPTAASPSVCSSPREKEREKPRRQSSISYVTSPTSLSRHSSLGPSSFPSRQFETSSSPSPKEANRRSTGSLPALNPEQRPPVTLVEKHADLLHFIAQKESKCLELRSQLAIHEAELAQLKRKWQRIVSRGLEKEREDSPLSATSESLTSPVLEGIREGVQGVSRLLAYGLSSPPTAPPTPPSSSLYSALPPLRPTTGNKKRTYQSSTSSISTFSTTQSNSESSLSSFDERTDVSPDTEHEEEEPPQREQQKKRKEREILMVRDTGASPLVSPNPEFIHQQHQQQQQQQKSRQAQQRKSAEYAVPVLDPIHDAKETLRARRSTKAKGGVEHPLLLSSHSSPAVSTTTLSSPPSPSPSPSPSAASELIPNVLSPLEYSEFSPAAAVALADASSSKSSKKTNRAGERVSLPPIGSMPGLALATMVSSPASQAVSSWVGSVVGKKWEDTISKNQKRASVLLSDVSQTIAQALASPSSNSVSPNGSQTAFSSNAVSPNTNGRTKKARSSPPPSLISTPGIGGFGDEDMARTPRVFESRAATRKPQQQQKTPPAPAVDDDWNW